MNNRLTLNYILFLILSFVVIFGYSYLFTEPPKKNDIKSEDQKQVTAEQEPGPGADTFDSPEKSQQPDSPDLYQEVNDGETVTIETPLYIAKINTAGARITEWKLKNYKETTEENSPLVNLIKGSEQSIYAVPFIADANLPRVIPYSYSGAKEIQVSSETKELELRYNSPSGISIIKRLVFDPDDYIINQSLKISNDTSRSLQSRLYLYTYGFIEYNGRGQNSHSFDIMLNNEVERLDSKPDEPKTYQGQVNWFGFSEQYFTRSIIPESGAVNTVKLNTKDNGGHFGSELMYPPETIPSGTSYSNSWKYYLGPKDGESLAKAGYNLESIVNFGWVEFLAKIALRFLKALNSFLHNYGLSIIAITLIFRIAFLPLTLRSMKSMKEMQNKMQKLKPKIDALKEKYKEDKTKQNSELMKLYSSHGVNPLSSLGGCLPLLIQLPVFIALYDVLLYSIEMRHSAFMWINDLSRPEQLFDIPLIGIPFRILPLLMGVSWFISQKLTPTSAPASDSMELQMKMMQFMPIIFTVMFWGLPSGLILYWTISNILSIGQQLYINRRVHT